MITISKISDESFQQKYEFNKFPITLGRENNNEIILQDPRKIISRSHASIIYNDGDTQLIDHGSSNFTYLNGEKILPDQGYSLNTKDKIKIGDYELEIILNDIKEAVEYDDQKTMVFSSPFAEGVSKICEDMLQLSEKYSIDDSPMKGEMLRLSLWQSLDSLPANQFNQIISEYFANKFLGHDLLRQNNKEYSSINIPKVEKRQTKSESHKVSSHSSLKSTIDYSFSTHFSDTVDIMLDTVIKLIQGFLQFRQEFFGVTIYQTIPTGSLKEIKEYLFNQEISSDEQRKRNNLIKEEAQKLLSHQLGLLEGYRTSVMEGIQSLLQSLDPEIIEKETTSKQLSGLGNFLPYSKKIKTLEAIKQSYKKYFSDPYHLEKKFFRPSFIKGYQKRISSKNEKNEY